MRTSRVPSYRQSLLDTWRRPELVRKRDPRCAICTDDLPTYLDELGRQVDRLEALPVLERVAAVGERLDAAAVLLAGSRRIELEAGVDALEVAADLERGADLLLGGHR